MPNKKKNRLSGIAFAVVAVLACVLFAFYGQMNTSSVMFGVFFQRDSISLALAQDEEWAGNAEEQALREAVNERRDVWLDANEAVEGSYTTVSAAGQFVNAGATLGYHYYDMGADRTAILLHGYEQSWKDAAVWAEFWSGAGWNVLIPVMRGYAGADSYTTAGGWQEQYDLYDLIIETAVPLGADTFALHGEGVGANAALFLSGNGALMDKIRDSGLEISLIVAESAYTSLDRILRLQMDRQFSMGNFLSGTTMSMTVNQMLGFTTAEADAVSAVSRSETPTLFITGEADTFVPAEMTAELYGACAAEKALYTVAGARHLTAYAADPDAYRQAVLEMLQ